MARNDRRSRAVAALAFAFAAAAAFAVDAAFAPFPSTASRTAAGATGARLSCRPLRPTGDSDARMRVRKGSRATALRVATRGGAGSDADADGAAGAAATAPWDELASTLVAPPPPGATPYQLREYASAVTLVRVGGPALLAAVAASALYTPLAYGIAGLINGDAGVFFVVANDSSQYIQNILTTCGLTFSILVGQTYYFMYQQQEAIFVALFEEVSEAKSLLEQVSLVSQGRSGMYAQILESVARYVDDDLRQLRADPAILLSARPEDDPLETVMYLTSVGEPSIVYDTVKSLRQARAARLGALQRKLPPLQMVLLWTLALIILATFPLLGAGSQTLGGPAILSVQSAYISFIVFGVVSVMGVIEELRQPGGGAYNVDTVLEVMVRGLEDELHGRMDGRYVSRAKAAPTVDSDPATMAYTAGARDEEEEVNAAAAAMGWPAAAAEASVGPDLGPDDGGTFAGDGLEVGSEDGDVATIPPMRRRKRDRLFGWINRSK